MKPMNWQLNFLIHPFPEPQPGSGPLVLVAPPTNKTLITNIPHQARTWFALKSIMIAGLKPPAKKLPLVVRHPLPILTMPLKI